MVSAKRRALMEYRRHGQRGAYRLAKASCKLYKKDTAQWRYWNEVRQWLRLPKTEYTSKGLVNPMYAQTPSGDGTE